MHFFELQIDFLVPLWRRVLLVGVCLGWGLVEFLTGAVFWGVVFGALGVYALHELFLDGWPASRQSGSDTIASDTADE